MSFGGFQLVSSIKPFDYCLYFTIYSGKLYRFRAQGAKLRNSYMNNNLFSILCNSIDFYEFFELMPIHYMGIIFKD